MKQGMSHENTGQNVEATPHGFKLKRNMVGELVVIIDEAWGKATSKPFGKCGLV